MKYFSELASIKAINAETVLASASYTSSEISCSLIDGYFSLQVEVTGDGTCKFEALPSNDGTNFLDTEPDILTSQTKTTGPASDGKNFVSFELPACRSFKLKVTETGGVSSVIVSAWVKAQ